MRPGHFCPGEGTCERCGFSSALPGALRALPSTGGKAAMIRGVRDLPTAFKSLIYNVQERCERCPVSIAILHRSQEDGNRKRRAYRARSALWLRVMGDG